MKTYHITANIDGIRFLDHRIHAQSACHAFYLLMDTISLLKQNQMSRIVIQEETENVG